MRLSTTLVVVHYAALEAYVDETAVVRVGGKPRSYGSPHFEVDPRHPVRIPTAVGIGVLKLYRAQEDLVEVDVYVSPDIRNVLFYPVQQRRLIIWGAKTGCGRY